MLITKGKAGAETLAKLAAGPAPGLVVTDLTMPGADGREVALRATGLGAGVGVVIVSGFAPDADRLGDETGAVFLHKPYSPADLIRAADVAVGISKSDSGQTDSVKYPVGNAVGTR